jgi:hypothetical protein
MIHCGLSMEWKALLMHVCIVNLHNLFGVDRKENKPCHKPGQIDGVLSECVCQNLRQDLISLEELLAMSLL